MSGWSGQNDGLLQDYNRKLGAWFCDRVCKHCYKENMKLYEVSRNTRVRIVTEERVPPGAPPLPAGMEINFGHVDGMYSYCTDDDKNVVHLAAWTEVEIVK